MSVVQTIREGLRDRRFWKITHAIGAHEADVQRYIERGYTVEVEQSWENVLLRFECNGHHVVLRVVTFDPLDDAEFFKAEFDRRSTEIHEE